MIYRAELTDTVTGETRVYSGEAGCEPLVFENGARFLWEGGNYACDCNRSLFFARAAGEDPDLDSAECSNGRYRVRLVGENGATLYEDQQMAVRAWKEPTG